MSRKDDMANATVGRNDAATGSSVGGSKKKALSSGGSSGNASASTSGFDEKKAMKAIASANDDKKKSDKKKPSIKDTVKQLNKPETKMAIAAAVCTGGASAAAGGAAAGGAAGGAAAGGAAGGAGAAGAGGVGAVGGGAATGGVPAVGGTPAMGGSPAAGGSSAAGGSGGTSSGLTKKDKFKAAKDVADTISDNRKKNQDDDDDEKKNQDGSEKDNLDGNEKDKQDNDEKKKKDKDASQNGKQSNDSDDDESDDKKKKNSPKNKLGKKLAMHGAMQAGAAAGRAMIMSYLLNMLKLFLQMMAQLFSAIASAVMSAIQAVVAVVMQVATAVAAAVGVSVVAATFGIFGVLVIAVVAVVAVVVDATNDDVAKYDSRPPECAAAVEEAKSKVADVNASEQTLKNAKLAYSFYSTYGAPDEHIAGILGNWSCESGIDPTSLEGIFDEPFTIDGEKKTNALYDLNGYTLNVLFPMYAEQERSINHDAYIASDGLSYCGLGLGGWTGPRCLLLLQTASSMNLPWYSMELQLIFSIATDSRRTTLSDWFTSEESNPTTAATYFMETWEGIGDDGSLANRQSKAEEWFVQIGEWEADVDYANSLIALAGAVKLDASAAGVRNQLDNCQSERKKYDNSSIAHAAVAYSHVDYHDSVHNNGTTLYQTVHDVVYPGDIYYASCDRGSAVAVRWSGYDTAFPSGDCTIQYSYCTSSPKWTTVQWNNDVSKLEPGDILICNNCHTLMYVGNEIIREVWGDDAIDALDYYANRVSCVEASYGNRSPGLVPLWSEYIDDVVDETKDDGTTHTHVYAAFRCTDPDMSDMYNNAADGVSTHVDTPWSASPYGDD